MGGAGALEHTETFCSSLDLLSSFHNKNLCSTNITDCFHELLMVVILFSTPYNQGQNFGQNFYNTPNYNYQDDRYVHVKQVDLKSKTDKECKICSILYSFHLSFNCV